MDSDGPSSSQQSKLCKRPLFHHDEPLYQAIHSDSFTWIPVSFCYDSPFCWGLGRSILIPIPRVLVKCFKWPGFFPGNFIRFQNSPTRLSGNASETLILIPLKKSPPETQLSKTSSSGGHSVSIACGISWFLGNKLILNSMLIKRTTEMILCIKKTSSYTNRPSLRIVGSHRKS